MGNAIFTSNKSEPLISVIVPVFQVESYLHRCVESILGQTYSNFELLLIDDGSPDDAPLLCDEMALSDVRIHIFHKRNNGVSGARNIGLEVASGEYIAYIDSDDFVDPDYLERLLDVNGDVIVGGSKYEGALCVSDYKKNYYYSIGGLSGPCNKLYRKECVSQLRFREDIPVGEDIVYNLSVLNTIKDIHFLHFNGYHVNDKNMNSLTRHRAGRYDYRLDEEYQSWWGKIQEETSREAGIGQAIIAENNANGCSDWIFQKIMNQCYDDCPNDVRDRLERIDRQIKNHRKMILSVEKPISPKTYFVVRICAIVNQKRFTYFVFRLLRKVFRV